MRLTYREEGQTFQLAAPNGPVCSAHCLPSRNPCDLERQLDIVIVTHMQEFEMPPSPLAGIKFIWLGGSRVSATRLPPRHARPRVGGQQSLHPRPWTQIYFIISSKQSTDYFNYTSKANMPQKRSLDNFFTPISQKKARLVAEPAPSEVNPVNISSTEVSNHSTYPFPLPHLQPHIIEQLNQLPASPGKEINNQPDLDLLYFQPYIPRTIQRALFEFLRNTLFFYRVQYTIKRYGTETHINTPRFTTVFGVDTSSTFTPDGFLIDSHTSKPPPLDRYKTCTPRPIPHCLDHLRQLTEIFTGASYNFCLVNYYANGSDSISYHSDDERFLGANPTIASLSLGSVRDFCMKHKPILSQEGDPSPAQKSAPPLKLPLASGDMVLMRGTTQANWLHSIPKRKGKGSEEGGRINITFRKGVERYSTQNYYQYNVGEGGVWRWDGGKGEMREWAMARGTS